MNATSRPTPFGGVVDKRGHGVLDDDTHGGRQAVMEVTEWCWLPLGDKCVRFCGGMRCSVHAVFVRNEWKESVRKGDDTSPALPKPWVMLPHIVFHFFTPRNNPCTNFYPPFGGYATALAPYDTSTNLLLCAIFISSTSSSVTTVVTCNLTFYLTHSAPATSLLPPDAIVS